MPLGNKRQWSRVERQSAMAFLVAGISWLADTTLLGLEMLDLYTSGPLNGVLLILALLASMVGLFGFYPGLSDKHPRLAITCAGIVAVAAVGLVVAFIWQFGSMALASVSTPPGFLILPPLVGFVVIGGVSLWSAVPSRVVGVLLLVNLGTLLIAVPMTDWLQFGLVAATGVIALAISYRLRAEFPYAARAESAPSTTTR